MRYSNISSRLDEGVKFTSKEINHVLQNNDMFNVGIEYEFHANGDVVLDVEEKVQNVNMPYIDNIHPEHDEMTEVVTHIIPSLQGGLTHIKNFFEFAKNMGYTFPSTAGLHISISYKNVNRANLIKFLVLLSGDYLHSIFPERRYVTNITKRMKEALSEYTTEELKSDINRNRIKDIENILKSEFMGFDDEAAKYITAKVADFDSMDGRIELRFFGGKDYDKLIEKIKYHLIRACYILILAYDDTVYRKEYIRSLYKLLPDDKSAYDKEIENIVTGRTALNTLEDSRLRLLFKHSKDYNFDVRYAYYYDTLLPPDREKRLLDNMEEYDVYIKSYIELYVETHGRWYEFEDAAVRMVEDSMSNMVITNYLRNLHQNGIQESIEVFENSDALRDKPKLVSQYMHYMDRHDWEEGQEIIKSNGEALVMYANLKGERDNEIEKELLKMENTNNMMLYVTHVAKERVKAFEPFIMASKVSFPRYYESYMDEYWTELAHRLYRRHSSLPKRGMLMRSWKNSMTEFLKISLDKDTVDNDVVYNDFKEHYIIPMLNTIEDNGEDYIRGEIDSFKPIWPDKYQKYIDNIKIKG